MKNVHFTLKTRTRKLFRSLKIKNKEKIWFCSEGLVVFVVFDHFCLDLVGLVLSEFVWSYSFEKNLKNNGLKYRVAAQLKTPTSAA